MAVCTGCEQPVEHDVEAEAWLKSIVLVDPNVLDGIDTGRVCPATGTEHQVDE